MKEGKLARQEKRKVLMRNGDGPSTERALEPGGLGMGLALSGLGCSPWLARDRSSCVSLGPCKRTV